MMTDNAGKLSSDVGKASTGLIKDFVSHYHLERTFIRKAAEFVQRDCQRVVRTANPQIRAHFSCRAKRPSSLRAKLNKLQKEENRHWGEPDDIWNGIFDMAGVRIALYLPSQSSQVEQALEQMLERNYGGYKKIEKRGDERRSQNNEAQQKQGESLKSYEPRFPGYDGTHYQFKVPTSLIEDDTDDSDNGNESRRRRNIGAEIQVVSATTHVWAEIEHDIEYKKKYGKASPQELRLLDGLKGVMSAVEIFLEQLEETWSNRIAEPKKKFANVADLMTFLTNRIPGIMDGRDNELHIQPFLEFLRKFDRDSREKLDLILEVLNFAEPANERLSSIMKHYEPLRLRPNICMMAKILEDIKQEDLHTAFKQEEEDNMSASKETYRCRVLIDCLKWFIADLFYPPEEVHEKFLDISRKLSTENLEALQWVIDGVDRVNIMTGAKPGDIGCKHINNLWQWFSLNNEPMISFTFNISRLGIQAPGDLWRIGNHGMYDECLDLPISSED